MKLIVDSNILFTYFWKESVTRKILLNGKLELFSPEFALEEINRYKKHIKERTNLTEREFNSAKIDIGIGIIFVAIEEYKTFLKKALEISPDKNDIDFFALALKLKIPIWSNDKNLKKQNIIKVYSTEEILNNLIF